jgi:HEAT repeat protein
MIEALHDTASSASPAFCHISRSLSNFRNDQVKEALAKHLLDHEPWIRVDSVNALAKWPLEEISALLVTAFADHHDFIDYSSVALARVHNTFELLGSEDENIIELGASVLVGVLEAAGGSFSSNSDLLTEVSVQKCLSPLQSAAAKNVTPARLRALRQLCQWLDINYHQYRLEVDEYPEPEQIAQAKEDCQKLIAQLDINAAINAALAKADAKLVAKSAVRHAITLTGELHLKEAVPLLKDLLTSAPVYRNDVIEALGLIGDEQCAPLLVKLAKSLVNLEYRTQTALSANPIHEAEPEKAKTYWFILRALGNLTNGEALAFLLEAAQDEASDKREEALSSLIKLWSKSAGKLTRAGEVKNTLQKCLSDPSPQVRIRAIEGAAILDLPDLIGPLVGLINAQEMSVNRAAFSALEKLATNGHKESVRTALTEARQAQSNTVKVKRIDEFIQHHL